MYLTDHEMKKVGSLVKAAEGGKGGLRARQLELIVTKNLDARDLVRPRYTIAFSTSTPISHSPWWQRFKGHGPVTIYLAEALHATDGRAIRAGLRNGGFFRKGKVTVASNVASKIRSHARSGESQPKVR
jgi:hypothetical protein